MFDNLVISMPIEPQTILSTETLSVDNYLIKEMHATSQRNT